MDTSICWRTEVVWTRPNVWGTPRLCPSTGLIDSAWGALQLHCGSVRPVSSVAGFKLWEMLKLFGQRPIRRPIRSRLCKYTSVLLATNIFFCFWNENQMTIYTHRPISWCTQGTWVGTKVLGSEESEMTRVEPWTISHGTSKQHILNKIKINRTLLIWELHK